MRRVALAEIVRRRGRTLALLLGILVATTSFAVLTGTSQTQRLDVRGTVARSFRGDYDILVRPRGARDRLERRTSQLRPNFLSDTFGGIATVQWRRIQRLPGVAVAAPLANVGYLLPTIWVPVDVSAVAPRRRRSLLRARATWVSDRGLTRVRDPGAQYAYVTPNRLRQAPWWLQHVSAGVQGSLREHVPGRSQPLRVCNFLYAANPAPSVIYGPFAPIYRSQLGCYSSRSHTGAWDGWPMTRARPQVMVPWVIPLLLTAVDPRAEARLDGLDRAVTSGRYLRPGDRPQVRHRTRWLPVLAAGRTYEDARVDVAVERLAQRSVARWIRPFPTNDLSNDFFFGLRWLIRRPDGPVVERTTVDAARAYRVLLRGLAGTGPEWDRPWTPAVWRTSPIGFARRGDALAPRRVIQGPVTWRSGQAPLTWAYPSPAAQDVGFRDVRSSLEHVTPLTPVKDGEVSLRSVGTFDPDRMGGAPQPGVPALRTIQPSRLVARDAAAARRLHGRSLAPDGHLGGYLAEPPSLITTLAGARAFGGALYPSFHPRRDISAIRVRVAGVHGIDAVSRERIRQAALRIVRATGLDVDIMAGASGAPTAIDLPAGRFGRPALALSETWVRKGVGTRVLDAIDRKSVLLFTLILVVCGLFVANATSAAVRARRSELGILSALGWPTGRLFGVVLAEVGAIGLAAGVLGALLALPLAALVGVTASPARAALAVPAATALALLAGLVPALRAARADPVDAVRPAVLDAHRARRPRTVGALALVNLARTPGRTVLGALSLAIGVCALTLLLAATLAFHDTLVGTLLGQAVSVDVRGSDYVAVVATVLLGVAAVADVLFLNLHERAAELATLSATGWDDRALGRLLALEGAWIGLLGALSGAAAGLAAAAVFAGALPLALVLTTIGAAAAGTVLAALAGLVPAAWVRRTPLTPVLAGE